VEVGDSRCDIGMCVPESECSLDFVRSSFSLRHKEKGKETRISMLYASSSHCRVKVKNKTDKDRFTSSGGYALHTSTSTSSSSFLLCFQSESQIDGFIRR
jgi:hypothetical protein